MELRFANYKIALWDCPDWQPISGYDGLYEVHWRGAVRNAKTKLLLRPGRAKAGYVTVALSINKKGKSFNIHTLNANAYLPNPENKRCVNHIDGIKSNNHLANLERATHKENNEHAMKIGLRKVKMTDDIIEKILSIHIKADKNFGAKAIAKIFGVNTCTIHEILNKHKYGNN